MRALDWPIEVGEQTEEQIQSLYRPEALLEIEAVGLVH